jgi:ribonuclease J
MTYNKKVHKNKLLFLPLGGSGEIGMNLNLYHYNGKWLIIDMGIGFASGTIPGVDIIVPETEFLESIKDDILAIVITHAHEDHLGAIPYLWEFFPVDIYTTLFNVEFIKAKLSRSSFKNNVKYKIKKSGEAFQIGDFKLNFIQLCHSVPDMNAVLIEVGGKKIFHTGDWKFDDNPVLGKSNDLDQLKAIGDLGIDAMVCDSTNVLSEGKSGSEGELQKSLIDLIAKQKSLTVIGCFASNVARIISIAKAAKLANKKLMICGASLDRIITVAKKADILDDSIEIIPHEKFTKYKRSELVVLATGSQGEPKAALKRMAHNSYPNVKLIKGDTVIFSSKIIPGNDKQIIELFNIFAKRDINVITERDHFVHVSGHPNRDELSLMYDLIKPNIAIPVHGERYHLREHCKFAENLGVKTVINISNGNCFEVSEKGESVFKVNSGYVAVDGNSLLAVDSNIIRTRRKLCDSGVIIINVEINARKEVRKVLHISAPGLFCSQKDKDILDYMADHVFKTCKKSNAKIKDNKSKEEALINSIRSNIRSLISKSINKNPVIEILLSRN